MAKIVLALFGVVLAFAVCRAETCAPPNVPRAILRGYYASVKVACPASGLCYDLAGAAPVKRAWWIEVFCLTPAQHAESLELGAKP